jgi:diguanylate cyclase (GGDEF)-like protein
MFFWGVIIFCTILFLVVEILNLRQFIKKENIKKEKLLGKLEGLREEEVSLKEEVDSLEKRMTEYFSFYELARKMAPSLKREELLNIFSEEIKAVGEVEEIRFDEPDKDEGYLKFKVPLKNKDVLYIKTKSKKVIEYIPHFVNLLTLCLEKIDLYEKIHQLSIYDNLTGIYNRRYFLMRYYEEFQRAKKFKLNLSFLMVDIDDFKKINDNYGHLVGDVILKEIATILKSNMREIDFVARFGGEEFSIILPETDKAGAIMVGERICARVFTKKMKVFDERLTTTISVGVGSYPQNTLYSDVLIEIADKALYKAKVSGKNRVCAF